MPPDRRERHVGDVNACEPFHVPHVLRVHEPGDGRHDGHPGHVPDDRPKR